MHGMLPDNSLSFMFQIGGERFRFEKAGLQQFDQKWSAWFYSGWLLFGVLC